VNREKTKKHTAPYLTIPETAEYLGLTPRGVRLAIAEGRLTAYRLGPRTIRLRRDEIDAAFTKIGGAV
jgi:excisionase family DNA binding protein